MPVGGVIQVYLVDDHEIVRRGLQDLIQRQDDFWGAGEPG